MFRSQADVMLLLNCWLVSDWVNLSGRPCRVNLINWFKPVLTTVSGGCMQVWLVWSLGHCTGFLCIGVREIHVFKEVFHKYDRVKCHICHIHVLLTCVRVRLQGWTPVTLPWSLTTHSIIHIERWDFVGLSLSAKQKLFFLRLSAWGVFILSQANPSPATAHGPTCPSAGPCRHQPVQPDTGAANPAAAAGQTEAAPGAPAEEDRTGAGTDQSSAGTTTWGCKITVSQSHVRITIQGFRFKLKPEHYLSAVMAIHCF